MVDSEATASKYLADFTKHMKVDEVALTVLKGHLYIEMILNNILEVIFFYPDYVADARMSFYQKLHIARGHAFNKDKIAMWDLILAVNALRNEIAHNLDGKRRAKKMEALRSIVLADPSDPLRSEMQTASDDKVVRYACAISAGFLDAYEENLKDLRGLLDTINTQSTKKLSTE
jgi:hypothetical protein